MILSVFSQLPFVHDIVCLLSVMAKGKLTKDRQYHGQREADKRQKISWPKGHDIVCLLSVSLWL
jgi:hypothetical protein